MTDLLVAGGLLFTIPLTVLALTVLGTGVWGSVAVYTRGDNAAYWTQLLFHLGLFAFILGILSQGIGLYQAMSAIEAAGDVSFALVMGGLKVSMIAPLFGIVIFILAMLLRFGLDLEQRRRMRVAA